MKKLLLAFSILSFVLSSCSKSDEPQPANPSVDTSNILIKKIIETVSGVSVTSIFTYNGNKIVSITDSNNKVSNYTYTGDLITGMEYYSGTTLSQKDTFAYNSGNQLTTYIRLNYNGVNTGNKTVYTYNTDGTISFVNYSGDLTTQTTVNGSGKLFFLNGEITKVENYVGTTTTLSSTTNYTYDDKSHPYKNILGYDKTSFLNGNPKGIGHNFLSRTPSSGTTYTFSYIYDSNGFPTNETKMYSGNTATKQYFY